MAASDAFVHHVQWSKGRDRTEAMIAGWPGKLVPAGAGVSAATRRDAVHVVGGLQYGALECMKAIRAQGLRYLFFDRAYFGGEDRARFRISVNAHQKHWIEDCPPGRAAALGVTLAPWRRSGSFILVVPPGPVLSELFGIAPDWERQTIARLAQSTDRPARVSPKSDRGKSPLADRLRGCWCVVTWTSNVAVEAIVAGVPAITARWAAAAPVAGDIDEMESAIESPPVPDRAGWAESLAWGQFTVEEARSGFARRALEGAGKRDLPGV